MPATWSSSTSPSSSRQEDAVRSRRLDPEGFTLAREGSSSCPRRGTSSPTRSSTRSSGATTATGGHRRSADPGPLHPERRRSRRQVQPRVREPERHARRAQPGDGRRGALFQDGPASSFTNGSLARILTYDAPKRSPIAEYVYEVAPWAEPSGDLRRERHRRGAPDRRRRHHAGDGAIVLGRRSARRRHRQRRRHQRGLDRGRDRRVGRRRPLRRRLADRSDAGVAAARCSRSTISASRSTTSRG